MQETLLYILINMREKILDSAQTKKNKKFEVLAQNKDKTQTKRF